MASVREAMRGALYALTRRHVTGLVLHMEWAEDELVLVVQDELDAEVACRRIEAFAQRFRDADLTVAIRVQHEPSIWLLP